MINDPKKKIIIVTAVILFIVIDLFVIYYFRYKSVKKENFKYYNNLNITEDVYNIPYEDYVSDSYLLSLIQLDNFDGSITYDNAESILRYYMTTISTAKDIKNTESDYGFCISKSSLEKSFLELFNIDVSNMYDSFSLPNYVTINGNEVCFEYFTSDLDDSAKFIGMKNIGVKNGIITATLYLYSIDITDRETEESFRKNLIASINNNTLEDFDYYFNQSEIGESQEKEIVFKEIPDGNYFKYQLISIHTK